MMIRLNRSELPLYKPIFRVSKMKILGAFKQFDHFYSKNLISEFLKVNLVVMKMAVVLF